MKRLALLAVLAFAAPAQATPLSIQDERHITCGAPEERQYALDLAVKFGADRVRINAIENTPDPGCDPVAAALAVAATGKLQPQITVVGMPDYAAGLARNLGRYVKYWSVWNEPNLSGWHWGPLERDTDIPAGYRRLYTRMRRAIQRNDPGAYVLFGELPPRKDFEFIQNVLAGRQRTVRTEGLAIHPYQWALPRHNINRYMLRLKAFLRRLARERALCLPKTCKRPIPIYVTEFGGASDVPLRSGWQTLEQHGVRQLSHYQLIDSGQGWDTALVETDGTRRPVWHQLRKLATR